MTFDLPERDVPTVVRWGRCLLGTCIGLLFLGGATVSIFFPELKGRGLDTPTLSILVPIWAIGIAGILLLLVGWIRYPGLDADLD